MSRPDLPPALRTLLDAAAALARRSSSSRIVLGRLHGVVDPGLLPTDVRAGAARELEAARTATAEPLSSRDVEGALRRAWDARPGDVLDALDPEPAAVRPDAQVHHAEHEGDPVTVVVQRPGLAKLVRNDLALLDVLALPLGAALPRVDAARILREVRDRTLDELDLEHEASVQRGAARALRRNGLARVAAPRTTLAAGGVLVTDRVDGPTLADAAPDDPGAVARALLRVFVGAPRELGMVFADPRADEVVVDDGTVVLRRMGSARPVESARIDAARDALAALRDDDAGAFATALASLGVLREEDARTAHGLARELLGDLLSGPALLDVATVGALADRAAARAGELLALAQRATPDAADLWPARMVGQLVALLAPLGATEDWGALALEALDRGWR